MPKHNGKARGMASLVRKFISSGEEFHAYELKSAAIDRYMKKGFSYERVMSGASCALKAFLNRGEIKRVRRGVYAHNCKAKDQCVICLRKQLHEANELLKTITQK